MCHFVNHTHADFFLQCLLPTRQDDAPRYIYFAAEFDFTGDMLRKVQQIGKVQADHHEFGLVSEVRKIQGEYFAEKLSAQWECVQ